jgi:luciferase family oxidoreductase group 1
MEGSTIADAVAATLDHAQAADQLGFHRYWCAEHHGSNSLANPCPEIMIARIASLTKHLRVGSGGVMLPYYSSWKVAEQFLMLETLFPGRIDLGLGRAPGSDRKTSRAVAAGPMDSDQFPQQTQELIALFNGTIPEGHPYHGIVMQPQPASRPELWMLGSSDYGGALAAQLGIRYCFAHFINPESAAPVCQMYRSRFEPGNESAPHSAIALFVICADTEQEAADLAAAVDLRRLYMAYGHNVPIPSIERARAQNYSPRDEAIMEGERPRAIIGTPNQVVERMHKVQEECQADEIVVLTVAASYAARMRSTELLAQSFGLNQRG